MENTFLSKLILKRDDQANAEQKHFLYIESKWLDNSLELHLHTSDTNKTFKGELSAEQFGRCANELDVPFDEFYTECKEALTANINLPPFEYEINEDDLTFRLVKKDKFAIEYLEIALKVLNNNSAILEAAVNLINDLREARNEQLNVGRKDDSTSKELLAELNNCLKEKEAMEKKLLSRFLLLLNSKKDKIHALKQKLQENNTMDEDQNKENDDDFEALTQEEVLN